MGIFPFFLFGSFIYLKMDLSLIPFSPGVDIKIYKCIRIDLVIILTFKVQKLQGAK